MGCISSKTDINDLHPNVFQVINVDEAGNRLSTGQLEITESHLIFYQRKKEPIKWPLRSLRRYGYDRGLFSFESGRRCPTGAGIYAFRCERADQLFSLLQSKIHVRNTGEDAVSRDFPAASNTAPTLPAPITVHSSDGNYLDPAPLRRGSRTGHPSSIRFVSQSTVSVRLSSVGSSSNGPISPQDTASPSPPPIPIAIPHQLPATPVSSAASATYVNEEIFSSATDKFTVPPILEITKKPILSTHTHFPVNGMTPVKLSSAVTESDSRCPQAPNIPVCEITTQSTTNSEALLQPPTNTAGSYVNIDVNNVPSALPSSVKDDSYAQLDLSDVQPGHLYMNVVPGSDVIKTTDISSGSLWNKNAYPSCVVSAQKSEMDVDEPRHFYANLEPGNIEVPLSFLSKVPPQPLPQTPTAERVLSLPTSSVPSHQSHISSSALNQFRQVNYIVLDLEQSKEPSGMSGTLQHLQSSPNSTSPAAGSASTDSPHRGSEGYATIDFNKTVALSHSVNPSIDNDSESSRKTRHNSTISELVSAPTINSPTE